MCGTASGAVDHSCKIRRMSPGPTVSCCATSVWRQGAAVAALSFLILVSWAPGVSWAISWQAPKTMPGSKVFDPHVAVDPTGNAVAVWTVEPRRKQGRGPFAVAEAARLPVGGRWSRPKVLGSDPHQDPSTAVAFDGSGVATIVVQWGFAGKLQTTTVSGRSRWSKVQTISRLGTSCNCPPSVAENLNGDVVLGFDAAGPVNNTSKKGSLPTSFHVLTRSHGKWSRGPSWPAESNWDTSVAINDAGDMMVSWTGGQFMGERLMASTKPAGGEWSSAATLGQSDDPQQAVIDAAGMATVVWLTRAPEAVEARSATARTGGAWEPTTTLDSNPSGVEGSDVPQIAVDQQRNLTAVWPDTQLRVATRAPDQPWSSPSEVAPPPNSPGGSVPQLLLDGAGDALIGGLERHDGVWEPFTPTPGSTSWNAAANNRRGDVVLVGGYKGTQSIAGTLP